MEMREKTFTETVMEQLKTIEAINKSNVVPLERFAMMEVTIINNFIKDKSKAVKKIDVVQGDSINLNMYIDKVDGYKYVGATYHNGADYEGQFIIGDVVLYLHYEKDNKDNTINVDVDKDELLLLEDPDTDVVESTQDITSQNNNTLTDKVTITFVDNNKIIKKKVVKKGQSITPPTINKAGYQFMGWDNNLTNITEDLTVRAIFMKIPILG